MSEASELFWSVYRSKPLLMPGDTEALDTISQAAERWRRSSCYLNAGLAMTQAITAAWGTDRVHSCALAAQRDYQTCVERLPRNSLESLLALYKQYRDLYRYLSSGGPEAGLLQDLASRFLDYFGNDPNAEGFLVKGFILSSNLDELWTASFPPYEVLGDGETWGGQCANIQMPSAFRMLIWLTDYRGAREIIERHPAAFTCPGLQGWRAAVLGFVNPAEAPERFTEAADAFAQDTLERPRLSPSWRSTNKDLWAPYFRARAALSYTVREPSRAREFVRSALSTLTSMPPGWRNGNVSRFRILVRVLSAFVGADETIDPEEASLQFLQEGRLLGGDPADEVSLRFFWLVNEALKGLKADPLREIATGRISAALETLARIPHVDPGISSALAPIVGEHAVRAAQATDRTWVYMALESISDEAVLRKVLLRLLQSSPSPPAYGQIRHGPLEAGKDVVVLLEEEGRAVLRMYQVKCGDITKGTWREARQELEEIFDVELSDFQLPTEVDERVGFLVCNGHANAYAEPVMSGWFKRQTQDHHRVYRFMHLDDVVNWIDQQRLYSAFRTACLELGLPTSGVAARRGQARKGGRTTPRRKKPERAKKGGPKGPGRPKRKSAPKLKPKPRKRKKR